ncbi:MULTISPECIES: TlpA family protein disulfide reductase [unclassified Pseudoalteromonas]|uniref:TlpA family protein disulfide reductase n=1 Tax=unclassified Pseudoalteromonas TaxID=194690 RepID=UPI00301534FC
MKSLLNSSLIILMVSVLSACNSTATTAPSKPGYETYIEPGDTFKHLKLETIEGQVMPLNQHQKKLVIFFATWCSDSQRLLNELKHSALLQDPSLAIIAIGREQDAATLAAFKQTMALPIYFVADEQRAIYSRYANQGIPRVILLDEQNTVMQTLIGEQPNTLAQLNLSN